MAANISIPQSLEKRSLALELAVRFASLQGSAKTDDILASAERFFAFITADATPAPTSLLADSVPFNKDA